MASGDGNIFKDTMGRRGRGHLKDCVTPKCFKRERHLEKDLKLTYTVVLGEALGAIQVNEF